MRKKLFLSLLFLIIPTVALARVGTGIGISFPIGAGGGYEETVGNVSSYAAFTDGVLMQELIVENKNGKYVVTFQVTNLTESAYTVHHSTGQNYELAILGEKGNVLQKWSDDIAYTQAFQDEVYPAKETVVHRGSFDSKKEKTLAGTPMYISAKIADTKNTIIAKLPTKTTTRSNNGGIRGSIIITNGHGDW